ncbi:MAG: dTDP-4-dehydrorhamnose reductase [Clostridia bacterium]|nr:dTDP-4-dehydrorhamnose reductase [Clostridia bacterium]
MKLFVTGVNGQLGYDVVKEASRRGYTVIASDITIAYQGLIEFSGKTMDYVAMDITDAKQVNTILLRENPDVVIHCAAWTAVDAAESPENMQKVYEINAQGTKNIAECCKTLNCKMIYISTDYVFDGQGVEAWRPDCKTYAPLNVYGKSKLLGEQFVEQLISKFYIVRIAWVFGLNGNNFVKTMLNVGKKYDVVRVVNDQIGSPTYTFDLSRLLLDMAETDKYGYYHATNSGEYISWYEFCCEIYKMVGYTTQIIPVSTDEYGVTKARRPFNSRLNKEKLVQNGFKNLPHWKDALADYLNKLD